MNRKKLIKYVSDKTMVKQTDLNIIFDVFLNKIKECFVSGEKVTLKNFGSFHSEKRLARKAINPKTRESIDVPEKKVIKFRISKNIKINHD